MFEYHKVALRELYLMVLATLLLSLATVNKAPSRAPTM